MRLASDMTQEKMRDLQDLIAIGRCDEVKNVLYGVELEPFQTLLVKWILIVRKFICALDTGLGKTLIASAVMKILHDSGETDKFLYVVENAGLIQTANKVMSYTGLRVVTCDATESKGSVLEYMKDDSYDVLMISYQAIQSFDVARYLIKHIELFDTVMYDECQWISELNNSNTWEITKQMRRHFRDVVMFSATPFRTNPMQLLKQVELLDKSILGNINEYINGRVKRDVMYNIVEWYGLDEIKKDLVIYVNGFTREELGIKIEYNPVAHVVMPIQYQLSVEQHEIHKVKAFNNADSMKELISIVSEGVDDFKQGIIYCSTNDNKRLLLDELSKNGIDAEVIDGTISDKRKREEVKNRYLVGEIPVLIINVTTTLDLPSSYCIFYELCDAGTVNQFVGRCVRGLADTELDVHFILVDGTCEIEYFYNNLYKKSVYLQQALGKDGRLMHAIKKQVDNNVG